MIINISRNKKTIFSNPFNHLKLGWGMSRYCYHVHLKNMYKRYPEKFEEIKNAELICHDPECYKKICHGIKIQKILDSLK